jgi:hypothetical protein
LWRNPVSDPRNRVSAMTFASQPRFVEKPGF